MNSMNQNSLLYQSFNRINPNRSIPTSWFNSPTAPLYMFQSYQSRQFNPDFRSALRSEAQTMPCFNRINPDRSIPTKPQKWSELPSQKFQSYQSKQLNPDGGNGTVCECRCTNVSIVSIQTDQSRRDTDSNSAADEAEFQSYQSKQINPDTMKLGNMLDNWDGFNRINPNRSIPTSDN